MKTCLGCIVILLLIVCILVIPWGSIINWAEVAGVVNSLAWICLIAGFAIWFFSAAILAGGDPILMFPALIISSVKPPGLFGMLLMIFGFILLMFT